MQAKAKALAEDEKNLSILVGSCPSYKNIGLPQGPSQFRNYVDEELLSQHSLLVPSKFSPLQPAKSLVSQGQCLGVSLCLVSRLLLSDFYMLARVYEHHWHSGGYSGTCTQTE